jgi:hypothetical protein
MITPLLTVLISVTAIAQEKQVDGLPLLFHEEFKDGEKALERFEFDDPSAWKIAKDEERNVLALTRQCKYDPPVRSIRNRAFVKGLLVSQPFVLEVKLKSTVRDYGHRDLCILFGAVDDSHQFYVHLGKVADPNCNNIFLVDGKPRTNIATRTSKGTPWDDRYHTVRVVRKESGEVEVFWDGQSVMTADNKSFPVGKVGVGTFDDLGNFASITIWGKKGPEKAQKD